MKISRVTPPRRFQVGPGGQITLSDCARIALKTGESVVFLDTAGNPEYVIERTDWGFGLQPELKDAAPNLGLKAVIAGENSEKMHLLLVNREYDDEFESYLASQGMEATARIDGKCIVSLSTNSGEREE